MLGFPEKPAVFRWKALQSGIHPAAGSCLTVDPGQRDFLIKSKI
jgi:hypothetical protein